MRKNRRLNTHTSLTNRDPGLGRNLLVSFGLHLLVVALFTGVLLPHMEKDRRPVYYVDLVNLPVADPQAGRPDAAAKQPEPPSKAPEPAPEQVMSKLPPKAPPPEPEVKKIPPKEPSPKPEPRPKPEPKPESKPESKPEPKVAEPQRDYREALSAIEELKRKKEIEGLKERLAALAERDPRRTERTEAPVGMPEGKGTEEGISWELWIQTFLKANWSLSKYQVSRLDLEATVLIVYDASGNLVNYRFLEESGDANFDRSVKEAIFKEKKLPREPGERMEIEVVFNLKDLME